MPKFYIDKNLAISILKSHPTIYLFNEFITVMKLLKKLKSLLKRADAKRSNKNAQSITEHQSDTKQPITDHIIQYLKRHGWQYEARSNDGTITPQIHHLIILFSYTKYQWSCVFRINETSQLVSIFGILPEVVPDSHFAMMLMAIAKANLSIPFGSIELDPTDGEVHTKVSLDAEFTPLSDNALGVHLQGVVSLTELAQRLYDDVLYEADPSPIVTDYLQHPTDAHTKDLLDQYFEPTDQYQ